MKLNIGLLILILLLVGCDNSDKKHVKDVIKVEIEYPHVWPGTISNFQILSRGTFSVISLDDSVVKAIIENNTLIVIATGIGKTMLILKDGINDDLRIPINTELRGLYTEEQDFAGYEPKIDVTTNSQNVSNSILKELKNEMSKFNNAHYSFEADGRFWLSQQIDLNNRQEGTYIWDGKILKLEYAGKIETYTFQGINNGPRPYMFAVILNLTDKYKELYPDAGIKNVSVKRFLCAVPPFVTE